MANCRRKRSKIVSKVDENLLKGAKPVKSYAAYAEELKSIEGELAKARKGGTDILYASQQAAADFANRIVTLESQLKTKQAEAYAALLKEIDQLKGERRAKFVELHDNAIKQELKEPYQKLESARREVMLSAPYISDEQLKEL